MTLPWFKKSPEITSLRRLLHRTQLWSALFVIGITSLAITFAGIFTVVRYANHGLSLLGRTIGYNIEAAMVFNDREAIGEVLNYLAESEEIAEVLVYDTEGELLSHWKDLQLSPLGRFELFTANVLLEQPFTQIVTYEGRTIGKLELSVRSAILSTLLFTTGLILCVSLILSLVTIYFSSRYTRRRIVVPLARLSTVARSIARERNFKHRVPKSKLKELNYLAEDFNYLLREIQLWQGHMQKEHDFLSRKAQHDPLTGLPNRAQFDPALIAAMRYARKHACSCALLFIDCDEFKTVNDTLGHMVGDAVLLAVAERLSRHLRKNDLVVRLGGDEFAVLLYPIHEPEDALLVADKMLNSLVDPLKLPMLEQALQVSISVGVAVYPLHATTPEGLITAADKAMYKAKRSRSGKYMDEDYSTFHEVVVNPVAPMNENP